MVSHTHPAIAVFGKRKIRGCRVELVPQEFDFKLRVIDDQPLLSPRDRLPYMERLLILTDGATKSLQQWDDYSLFVCAAIERQVALEDIADWDTVAVLEEDPDEPGTGSEGPLRIFIAEDNPSDLYLLEEVFSRDGMNVAPKLARTGGEAIHFINEMNAGLRECPDLFLLDISLPGESGLDILSHLRQSNKCATTPVIVMTSSVYPQDRDRAIALGANYFFSKPTRFEEFMTLGKIIRQAATV